jgi:glycosyltransferase involved in cell wall biosynthesis
MAEEAAHRHVSAIVPAYNEAARITPVLDVLVSYPGFAEVLVVDDGSTDGTSAVATARGARVLRHPRKSGKGSAMQRGVDAAAGDVFFFCDADIQGLTHEIIAEILEPVRRGETEMFIGMIDRRIYDAPFIIRFVPLLGGIRALTRGLWQRTPPKFKKGFEIETALNFYADHPGRPQHKVFPGLTQTVKEKKYGVLRGTYWRWKMVLDILATNWVLHTRRVPET